MQRDARSSSVVVQLIMVEWLIMALWLLVIVWLVLVAWLVMAAWFLVNASAQLGPADGTSSACRSPKAGRRDVVSMLESKAGQRMVVGVPERRA